MEYTDRSCLDAALKLYREQEVKGLNMEVTRSSGSESPKTCVIFNLRLNKKCPTDKLLAMISATESVLLVEEL